LNAAKEKLEIVSGAAPPPAFLAGVKIFQRCERWGQKILKTQRLNGMSR